LVDEVIVATTAKTADDAIVKECERVHCQYYRGREEDVLARVVAAGDSGQADIIVEAMADSPFTDWRIVDYLVKALGAGNYDCATNEIRENFPGGFPDGLDMRVFRVPALKDSLERATDPEHHEHVSLFIYTHPDIYRVFNWPAAGATAWSNLRLTLDTAEDYQLIKAVYEGLWPVNPDFSANDVVDYLRAHPGLAAVNAGIKQKAPYEK
jgi:spore coat polysaccharide biosynthesis protein SpsF